ncbi:hypothetical protein DQ04_00171070 [Trypanosoma grayi]|uniref:hypothetical protein n=1 Tax=Trypanosoma grayi TaxID=71804 RepID=UPI0004F47443|nr:hypothetical protein DQ04_00171070 [Trypanosoma grayi]KEG15143.1 hypothetical protein DQ04_00171070 [Trypanosoma grayi]
MNTEPKEEKDTTLSERIRQLHRRIERAKPIFNQHERGELCVMNDDQRRQVNMYPMWLEDLKELRQGRLPPVRTYQPPKEEFTTHIENTKTMTDVEEAPTEMVQEAEPEPNTLEEVEVPRCENEPVAVADYEENVENDQQQVDTKDRERDGPIKQTDPADGFVGDPEADKERVVGRLCSLLPRARESFLKKYIERITDTKELRGVKKRYETASNVRQKILKGSISRPSKVQLDLVSELPELRRTLNVLKQHEKKEQQRLTQFFLQHLEVKEKEEELAVAMAVEKEEEKENETDEGEALPLSTEEKTPAEERHNSGNGMGEADPSMFRAPTPTTHVMEQAGGSEAKVQAEAAALLSSQTTTQLTERADAGRVGDDGTHPLGSSGLNGITKVHDEILPQASQRGESDVQAFSVSSRSSVCESATATAAATSPGVSHGVGVSSSNSSEKDRGQTPQSVIEWSRVKYFKNSVRLEIKAVIPPQERNQQTQNKRKSSSPSQRRDDTAANARKKKKRAGARNRMTGKSSHLVMEELKYVQLHMPFSGGDETAEVCEKIIDSEELETRAATVLRRIEREFQYIQRHPVPRVALAGSRVLRSGDSSSYSSWRGDGRSEDTTIAEWLVLVSPSDGPLAGQVVRVMVAFSQQYPFVPPLVYSTVFLPLTSVMVSESGQANTLRLPWVCATSSVCGGNGVPYVKSTVWQSHYTMHGLLTQLQNFFGEEAFATSREALGEELYRRSVWEARLACGRLTANYLAGGVDGEFPFRTALEVANGPFLVLSATDDNDECGEANKEGVEEVQENATPRNSATCYYEEGVQGAIHGPFEGCWGHLLMMTPTENTIGGVKEENDSTMRGVVGPVLSIRLVASAGKSLPKLELIAVSQRSILKRKDNWAESILKQCHVEGKDGDGRQQTLSGSNILARFPVNLNTDDEGSTVVCLFFEDDGESRPPRCVENDESRLTRVHLPTNSAFLQKKHDLTPLAWAVVLRVADGDFSTAIFTVPAVGKETEEIVVESEMRTSHGIAAVVKEAASLHMESASINCDSSLFCVASLDTEAVTEQLGVMCEVRHPVPSTHCFVPEEVVVLPNVVVEEGVFDVYFPPAYSGKKFFISTTPVASCTLFLPLAKPDTALQAETMSRLKLSITQLHRNPDASTAYTPPLKVAETLRFFVLALSGLARQWAELQGATEEENEKRMHQLETVYTRILCTFAQLTREETALDELCRNISATNDPFRLSRSLCKALCRTGGDDEDEEEGTALVKWILASWYTCTVCSKTANDAADASSTTTTGAIKTNWVANTTKFLRHLNEKGKESLVPEAQLHAKLCGAAIITE